MAQIYIVMVAGRRTGGRERKRDRRRAKEKKRKKKCWKASGRIKYCEYLKVNKSFPGCSASGPCVCVCVIYMGREN